MYCTCTDVDDEGREGVKWELGNGILCTGTGIHEKKQSKNGNGISISATQAGIVGFELGFEKKTISGKWD